MLVVWPHQANAIGVSGSLGSKETTGQKQKECSMRGGGGGLEGKYVGEKY